MRALVTGGGGFLGRAVVDALLKRGAEVRSIARRDYPALRAMGVETLRGDLCDESAMTRACDGVDIIFHVAAKAGVWGPFQEYYQSNVIGTAVVIAAAQRCGVPKLVYTSSPSVVFHPGDCEGADESLSYPDTYLTAYPLTKAQAERSVLAANGPHFSTVALRPHLIWGPGDNHLVPRILQRSRSLRRIGRDNKKIDSVYIDNAAAAHLCAADRLAPNASCAGRPYFISNGEPWPMWDLVNGILAAGGKPPVTKTVSKRTALIIATLLESAYGALRIKREPRLTRFVVHELSSAHWFDISAARRDLGYEPQISVAEGLKRLEHWLREHPIG